MSPKPWTDNRSPEIAELVRELRDADEEVAGNE